MLRLRPHHILDIVRNIGNTRPVTPHEYGHLVHTITEIIIRDPNLLCELVVSNDDICTPCRMLTKEGQCEDILAQLEEPVSKQEYNDELDRRLLALLSIEQGTTMKLTDYLSLVITSFDAVVSICTHPKEDRETRKNGLRNGIEMLLH
jgi:hypothetical protein